MSNALKTALTFAMIWAMAKMILFLMDQSELGFNVGVMSNFLFIILAITVTLWRKYKTVKREDSDTISDLAHGAKSALLYVVFVSIFSFVYYSFIDKDYLSQRADDRIELMKEYVYTDDNFAELKGQDEHITVETPEEYIEWQSQEIKKNYSLKFILGFGFSIWIFVSLISSFIVTLLIRNVLLK